MSRIVLASLCLAAAAAAAPRAAEARATAVVGYPYDKVWPAAIRFLRIDEGYTLKEKDADAGYVLFELVDDGKTFTGSLEVARVTDDDGRDACRLIVHIQDRPAYMEDGLISRFKQKLHEELGDPPPPPKPEKKKPAGKPSRPPAGEGAAGPPPAIRDTNRARPA